MGNSPVNDGPGQRQPRDRMRRGSFLITGNVVSAVLVGILGCWTCYEQSKQIDSIFPIRPLIGLVIGLIAGPAAFSAIWAFFRSSERNRTD